MSADRGDVILDPPLGALPFVGALVVALFGILSVRVAEDVARTSPPPAPADGNALLPKELEDVEPEKPLPEPPACELHLSGPESVPPGGHAEYRITARGIATRPVRLTLPTSVTATSCGETITVTLSSPGNVTMLEPKDDRILSTIALPEMPCRRGFGWGVLRADVEVAWATGDWANVQPLTATWQVREAKP